MPEAIENAKRNGAANGIANAEFYVGAAEEVFPKLVSESERYRADVIVVDPPRKGLDPLCIKTMLKMAPKRIVYVSCDSATLARDVKYLTGRGYELKRARCTDMFPHTVHVETVCLLERK